MIADINTAYDYSAEFIDFMVAKLRLSDTTSKTLRAKQISPLTFMNMDTTIARALKMDVVDSVKITKWIVVQEAQIRQFEVAQAKEQETQAKEQEAQVKKFKRARDKEEDRVQRERQKKSIFVLDPSTKQFDNVTLYDVNDFLAYTNVLQIAGLKKLLTTGVLDQNLIRPNMFDTLIAGAHYGYGKIEGSLQTAIAAVQSTIRKSAEFNFVNELIALHGRTIVYVGSDILLEESAGAIMGDVDSLFRSSNNDTFYLLERKTTLSADTTELQQQLTNTRSAFLQKLRDPSFRNTIGLMEPIFGEDAIEAIAIEQGVFYEAGSDRVADDLRDLGYHVLSPNRRFRNARKITGQ